MAINSVSLSGYLCKKPELRKTQSGMGIMKFSIAVNEKIKNRQTNEYEEHANYFNCIMFGNYAIAMYNYLHCGSKVALNGKLKYNTWTTKDGKTASGIDIIVNELDICSQKKQQQQQQQTNGMYTPQDADNIQYEDDDIPF